MDVIATAWEYLFTPISIEYPITSVENYAPKFLNFLGLGLFSEVGSYMQAYTVDKVLKFPCRQRELVSYHVKKV